MMRTPKAAASRCRQSELTDEEISAAPIASSSSPNHSDIDYARVIELAPLVVDTRNALNGDLRRGSRARIIQAVAK